MLLWQQKTIPVLHWAVCDSVYKNYHSFTQHCPAIKEKHARPWSLHLCDNNDFCSPLIISFGRCVSGCEKSWLASLSRIGQEETHRNTAPRGGINTTSTPLLNAQKEFWLSESKAVRATSSFRKCYKTFRMQIADIVMESVIQQVNKGKAELSEDIIISRKVSGTPRIKKA